MFLCTLLLLGVIYSRIHWILKAVLVISSLMFSVFAYEAYQNALGYPVPLDPPAYFRFVYGMSVDPNPSANDPGAIYLWILDPNGQEQPRAIAIPYSKENRKKIAEAKKQVEAGKQVYMGKSTGDGADDGSPDGKSGNGNGKQGLNGSPGSNTLPYNTRNSIIDFKQPPDTLPKKGKDNTHR